LKSLARFFQRHVTREVARFAAHVGRALHVVLSAQGIDARAGPPDVPGEQGQVRQAHHGLRPLHVLGHPEAVERDGRSFAVKLLPLVIEVDSLEMA